MRNSRIRSEILKLFNESEKPISALELIEKVKANKTTIYRELSFLTKQGMLEEIIFPDKLKRYELTKEHHHHLLCLQCGSIKNIIIEENFKIPSDFKLVRHNIEFFGFCRRCQ